MTDNEGLCLSGLGVEEEIHVSTRPIRGFSFNLSVDPAPATPIYFDGHC